MKDRLHLVLDREDEAGRALRTLLKSDVEPDRGVERGHLVQEDVSELLFEGRGVWRRSKIAAFGAPAGDRSGDPADHLLDRALTGGRAKLAAEVFLRDDVRRVLRPRRGKFDIGLLEGDPVAVADARIADLPLDGVEGVGSRRGEVPPNRQSLARSDALLKLRVRCVRHPYGSSRFPPASCAGLDLNRDRAGRKYLRDPRTESRPSAGICEGAVYP